MNSWHVRVRSDGIIDANDTYNTLPFDFESAPAQVRISKDGPTVTLYRDAELVFVLTPAPADGNLTRFGFLSADGTGRVWMDNLLISPQALGMTGMILR